MEKTSKGKVWETLIWVIPIVILLLVLAFYTEAHAVTGLSAEQTMEQASGLDAWEQELKAFEGRLSGEQQTLWKSLSDAEQRLALERSRSDRATQDANGAKYESHQQKNINAHLMRQIDAARDQAKDAEFQAALSNRPQTKAYGYADKYKGGANIIQTAPRQIAMTADGLGLSPKNTHITIVQPPPVIVPTPLPTPVPKQETKIKTIVNGIDNIETRAVLPEILTVDQLDAVKKIADNGTLIAQQRFGLAQYGIQQETQLKYLQIVKSFTLWGFIASIPFLLTLFHIGKGIVQGLTESKKSHYDYKLRELEASERVIFDKVPEKGGKP